MTCALAHLDGAYVLGALSPQERHEFEEHLDGCSPCRRSVQAVAGLPGLLARVDEQAFEAPAPVEEPPPTLLPALLGEVRRSRHARRRRTALVSGLAAAAAAAVAVGTLTLTGLGDGGAGGGSAPEAAPGPTSAPADPGRPMLAAGGDAGPLQASLAVEPVAWGTRLDLTCRYDATSGYQPPVAPSYALVVRTRDGRTERVATWHAVAGQTMRLSGATAAAPEEISSVEVRTLDGRPLLRLDS